MRPTAEVTRAPARTERARGPCRGPAFGGWCALAVLAACGEAPPPMPEATPPAPAAAEPAPAPLVADPGLAAAVGPLLRGEADEKATEELRRAPAAAVPAVIAAAVAGDVLAQGRAPELLVALGAEAVPALGQALQDPEPKARRIAVLALLQLGPTAAAAAPALATAAERDTDPAVRAAAQAAWKRATGDTSDLDRQRAQHEAALRGSR